jgi:ribosomal protein S18 acetylase RimI-like enzyme/trans-aconitate methyltransferase
MMTIEPIRSDEWPEAWSILHPVIAAGDTLMHAPEVSERDVFEAWVTAPAATFVARDAGRIVGLYYLKPNQPGLGSHVANAGYVVSTEARGRGIAALLCEHSQREAIRRGFLAMQFNCVVSTNDVAVKLWEKLGFTTVGRVPDAFNHRELGPVDILVMWKRLTSTSDPIALLFGGMQKLGPGSNADTMHVLQLLPRHRFDTVVDAGCGTGRQTLVLAGQLGVTVHAVDTYQPFLADLELRAREAQLADRVHVHRMDMQDIPQAFHTIDLLWSEGAAYSIGFAHALATWAPAMNTRGLVVVSELSWLGPRAPAEVREFFRSGYPDMRSVPENIAIAEAAGYRLLATHTLPRHTWVDGYYDVLGPRAQALLDHPDPGVREFAAETVREIDVFSRSEDSYAYVFYVLERP